MEIQSTPPPQLDYAPGRSLVTRVGRRRIITLTLVIAALIALTFWFNPALSRIQRWNDELRFLALQETLVNYVAPADRVVYEEDPAEAATLMTSNSSYLPIMALDERHTPIGRPGWQPPVIYPEP